MCLIEYGKHQYMIISRTSAIVVAPTKFLSGTQTLLFTEFKIHGWHCRLLGWLTLYSCFTLVLAE